MVDLAERQRQVKEELVKNAICQAALDVIKEYGVDALKMQTIAQKAGIATGTLYNYFQNKNQLVLFVCDTVDEIFLSQMEHDASLDKLAPKRLSMLVLDVFRMFDEYHVIFDAAESLGVVKHTHSDQDMCFVRGINCLKSILDSGISNNEFHKMDTTRTAKLMFFTLVGMLEWQKFYTEVAPEENARELQDMFSDTIKVKKAKK